MLAVFGLNREIWEKINPAERRLFQLASLLFLSAVVINLIAGVRFMLQLSDSYIIGILGGLIVGLIISMVVRIALITLISRPILPNDEPSAVPAQPDAQAVKNLRQRMKAAMRYLPSFSLVLRFLIITLMAIVIAMPIASLIGWNETERIQRERRQEIKMQFKENHPDMPGSQEAILDQNLQHEHFPIHVYKNLTKQFAGVTSIWICLGCFLTPFFMLWYLRSHAQFEYAKLNQQLMVQQIQAEYAMAISRMRQIQKTKFGLSQAILPNQAWKDAPFNTRKAHEHSSYEFESSEIFMERLKSL